MAKVVVLVLCCVAAVSAQRGGYEQHTTPVPILKQINRHNEDGSYSYGYEGADGSFKIETKFPNGEVLGKYGYVDDSGKVREVEYGASKRGFEVAGPGINVPPPTLVNNEVGNSDYDDGQYREDPSIYYKETASGRKQGLRLPALPAQQPQQPQQQQPYQPRYSQPSYTAPSPRTPSHVQQYFSQEPEYRQPAPVQPQHAAPAFSSFPQARYYNPAPVNYHVDPNQFYGHPARNINIATGSYSVQYSG